MRAIYVGALSALLVMCGSNPTTPFGDGGVETDASDASTIIDSGPPGFGDSGVPDSGPTSDGGTCPASALMIYVTGQPAELWSFWPPTFTFKKIGTLTCTSSPTHMTVDRLGNAWVVASGNVYKTSTLNASCSLLSTWKQQTGFFDFAVSLVGLTNTDTSLYVLGQSQLARFDIVSGSFNIVGTPAVPSTGGDMTSNGDGTLYFLQAYTTPHPLFELDPSNAKVLKTYNVNAAGTGSQALAYFGGRFYAFENNIVYEYDPLTNGIKTLGTAPLTVTGAGQSTCVPTVPTDAGPPN
jgi:hypothetical protein